MTNICWLVIFFQPEHYALFISYEDNKKI